MAQLFESDFQGSGSSAAAGPTKREDLADYISLIDAKDTPFSSMAPKGKDLGNMFHRWSVDSYEAAQTEGYKDGKDATDTGDGSIGIIESGASVTHGAGYAPLVMNHARNRDELSNFAQYFRRATKVSPLAAEVTNPVGGKNLLAQGVAKKTVELKRDMEKTLLSNNAPNREDGSGPYKTRGLGSWIKNLSSDETVDGSVYEADYSTPAGNIQDSGTGDANATTTDKITETAIQDVLESIYGVTGSVRSYDLICGAKIKRAFTNLTATSTEFASTTTDYDSDTAGTQTAAMAGNPKVRTFNQELGNTTFKNTITVFEGDFGTLNIHVDNFMPTVNTGYIVPLEMTEVRYGMLPRVQDIPNSGSGEGRIIEACASLVVKQPQGFGKFAPAAD